MKNEKRKKWILFCLVLTLLSAKLLLSATPVPAQAGIRTDQPFVLPQTIFVGDLGRMVVPLDRYFSEAEPFIVDTPERLPQTPVLVIRRIELERRAGISRLLIDFIPFAPGTLPFPDIEFFSQEEDSSWEDTYSAINIPAITGLQVHVSSILTPSQMALSEPAPPLAVPGTSLLIYGTIVLILVVLFLGIGCSLWGSRHFWETWELIRRKFLILGLKKFIRYIKEESSVENDRNPAPYLSLLSGEFREFLSLFTGINCRSMTAGEFLRLPMEYTGLGPVYLSGLFQTWDTLRFSGRGMEMVDLTQAMSEIEEFLIALEKSAWKMRVKV